MYATVLINALFVWHFCGPTLPKSAYGKVCDVLHGRIAPLPRFFSCLARGKTVMAWLVSVFKNRWLRWAVHHHNSQRPLSFNFKLNSMIPGAAEVNEFESRSVQLQPILPMTSESVVFLLLIWTVERWLFSLSREFQPFCASWRITAGNDALRKDIWVYIIMIGVVCLADCVCT